MTALEFLTQHRELTAAQIAEATGQHIEHVYAELVHAEALGLARVNTDHNHRCTWEAMRDDQ